MLKDRGYLVPNGAEPETLEQFTQKYQTRDSMMLKVSKEEVTKI